MEDSYQGYAVLGPSSSRRAPTTEPPETPIESYVLDVQSGVKVIYGEHTIPVSAVRVVHPTNPNAPSVSHSVAMVYVPPGAAMQLHQHETEETYAVLSGTGVILRNGGDREVGPGDFVYMPSWCHHGIVNTGKEMLTVLVVTSPPNG